MKIELLGYNNIIRSEENGCTCYQISQTDEEIFMRFYQVFPGITLIYEDVHAQNCTVKLEVSDNIFEIRHCREGRLEGNIADEFFYISPGDLCICKPQNGTTTMDYPLRHYHGITVMIDVNKTPHCLSCFLEDVNVQPKVLMQKFCQESHTFIARSKPSIAHIFEELYCIPENIRTGYLKVKILELMLFLTGIDVKTDELEQRRYSPNQKVLAKNVSAYLMEHMDEKITLEQLSQLFHVSVTQIQYSIKGVYGTSLHRMIRIQKMQSAAKMLQTTDRTILEIAGMHGYDNASKFSSAFKAVMGMSPKEYRQSPVKIENIFT